MSSGPTSTPAASASGTNGAPVAAARAVPETPALAATGSRIAPLDGIRGLAALLVFTYHCTVLEPRNLPETIYQHLTFLNGLSPLLFFVLSGFLITGILVRTRDEPHYFRNFYIRRGLRTLPLYYAVVILSLIVLPALFPHSAKVQGFGRVGHDSWMYWVFLQNFGMAMAGDFRHGILDVTWSLAIEEQFYFVWPLLVFVCRKRWLATVCIGIIAFGFFYRCLLVFYLEAHPITAYVLTFARLGSLATGSLLAIVWQQPGFLERVKGPAAWIAALTVPCIWAATGAERLLGIDFLASVGFRGGPYTRTFGDLLVLSGLASLVILCISAKPESRFYRVMTSRVLRTLALYSYGIFIFHTPVRAFIRDVVYGPGNGNSKPWIVWPTIMGSQIPAQLLFYVVAMSVVLPLAMLSYHLFEKQFLRLKGPLTGRDRPGAPPGG